MSRLLAFSTPYVPVTPILPRGAISVSIKVGIIGTGGISELHARGYHRAEDTECVACCDLLEDRVKEFAEKHGFARHYTDYRKMLASEDLDGISICTPNYAHKDPAVLALKRGILCQCNCKACLWRIYWRGTLPLANERRFPGQHPGSPHRLPILRR